MGGMGLLIVGCAVAILIGAGLGYALAAGRYVANLHALNQAQQELQRQVLAASRAKASESAVGHSPNEPQLDAQPVRNLQPERNPIGKPQKLAPKPDSPEPAKVLAAESPAAPAEEPLAETPSTTETPPTIEAASTSETPIVGTVDEGDNDALPAFVAAAEQSGALLIVDVDHLRKFRERYGAQLGDYVSSHVERVIRDALQATSALISRYQAQEFLVALPEKAGSGPEQLLAARRVASELRAEIERAYLQVGSERLNVTASIGVALVEEGISGEQIIARADEALHAAKRAGRNCGYYYHTSGHCRPVDPLPSPDAKVDATPEKADLSTESQSPRKKKSGCRDRRRHERMSCESVNLIAPCSDNIVPAIDKFERVQFLDLSVSGFSMILPAVPTADRFAVALFNTRGMIFMSAEIVNVRQAPRAGHGKPLVIVGCQFRQRLYPQEPMPYIPTNSQAVDPAISAILQSL
jgi:diguanylate cyclase (GGDEF)-like protein